MACSPGTAGEVAPDGLAVQVPLILAVLDALGIAVVGKDGYEADDVIGTLASTAPMPVDVVTGDRDLFQLVDDDAGSGCSTSPAASASTSVVDDAWVRSEVRHSGRGHTSTTRRCAAMPLTVCRGVRDRREDRRFAAEQLWRSRRNPCRGQRADTRSAACVAAKLGAAIDYLAVAPTVVAVVRDLDLGVVFDDLRLPTAPADPELFAELTELLGLGGSADRVLAAL